MTLNEQLKAILSSAERVSNFISAQPLVGDLHPRLFVGQRSVELTFTASPRAREVLGDLGLEWAKTQSVLREWINYTALTPCGIRLVIEHAERVSDAAGVVDANYFKP